MYILAICQHMWLTWLSVGAYAMPCLVLVNHTRSIHLSSMTFTFVTLSRLRVGWKKCQLRYISKIDFSWYIPKHSWDNSQTGPEDSWSIVIMLDISWLKMKMTWCTIDHLWDNCGTIRSAHLHSLHVVNSPACICAPTVEDTTHYFLDCPLYYNQRMTLRNEAIKYVQFNLNVCCMLNDQNDIDHDQ